MDINPPWRAQVRRQWPCFGLGLFLCACRPEARVFMISCPLSATDMSSVLKRAFMNFNGRSWSWPTDDWESQTLKYTDIFFQLVHGVPIKQTHGRIGRWCSLKARSVLNYLMDIESESGVQERSQNSKKIQTACVGSLRVWEFESLRFRVCLNKM